MTNSSVETLRQDGLAKIRSNQIEEAIPLFDRALALAEDEETRELITINKASAYVLLEEDSPEVQKLPAIIMRRRNPRHVLLASYYLQTKYRREQQLQKALFYARVALGAAEEAGATDWKPEVLIELGNLSVFESRSREAIDYYEEALSLIENDPSRALSRAFATQNLGYSNLLEGNFEGGVALLHEAVEMMKSCGAEGFLAEPYLDLCFGYLELGDLDRAGSFGEKGLELSTETRQVRNAHYLLGEIDYKRGDYASAEVHFDHLARFYPEFPNLKDLLFAIDLRSVVNFKL